MATVERLERRLEREKKARKEAERLLEDKSRELFHANQELQKIMESLEERVAERTEELLVALEDARQASKAKSQFLATMSHEIRTPMNGVMGMALLLQDTALDDTQQDYTENILKSAKGLTAIINDVLDLSKVEAGKLSLNLVNGALLDTMAEVQALLLPMAADKNIELGLTHEGIEEEQYRFDPVRLRQVVLNLTSNAIKFTEEGSVDVHLKVSSKSNKYDLLELSVRDTGVGIPDDKIATMFDKFTQLDGATDRRYQGTGLGLAITKSLVDLMGGEIDVSSEVGHGSCFKVSIPISRARREQPLEEDDESVALPVPEGLNILVAEDALINQQVAKTMLENMGQSVSIANDGAEAVDLARHIRFDLIFMDMQMPVVDGLEATRQIREIEAKLGLKTPIIALTANAMTEDMNECFKAGMDDFITKPLNKDDLERVLTFTGASMQEQDGG